MFLYNKLRRKGALAHAPRLALCRREHRRRWSVGRFCVWVPSIICHREKRDLISPHTFRRIHKPILTGLKVMHHKTASRVQTLADIVTQKQCNTTLLLGVSTVPIALMWLSFTIPEHEHVQGMPHLSKRAVSAATR